MVLEDNHYSKFGGVITCTYTSYYDILDRVMRLKRIVKVPKRVVYVVNT